MAEKGQAAEWLQSIGLSPSVMAGFGAGSDDWAFVIKAHALLETAFVHLLTTELKRPELEETFSALEMSDYRRGKAKIAIDLGLIEKRERRFSDALSTLRNRLVHDIRNTTFSFQTAHLDKKLSDAVTECTGAASAFMLVNAMEHNGATMSVADFVKREPRLTIWIGLNWMLFKFYLALSPDQATRQAMLGMGVKTSS